MSSLNGSLLAHRDCNRVYQNPHSGGNELPPAVLLHSPQVKTFFYIKMVGEGKKKIKRSRLFHDTWKVWEIQISVSINTASLEHSQACLVMDGLAFLALPASEWEH